MPRNSANEMANPFIHWRYVSSELTYRWKRSALLIVGIALAVTLVTTPRHARPRVRRPRHRAVPQSRRRLDRAAQCHPVCRAEANGDHAAVLGRAHHRRRNAAACQGTRCDARRPVSCCLWNLGNGSFISITGIPLTPDAPALGPGRVRDWLYQGRLPTPGTREVLVERHYGAFYRLAPGSKVDIGGEQFTVVGVVDIEQGSQIVASNFYMDINEARQLAGLPPDLVNQVFLNVSDMAQTESRQGTYRLLAVPRVGDVARHHVAALRRRVANDRPVSFGRGMGRRAGRAGAGRHVRLRQFRRTKPRARNPTRDRLGAEACAARNHGGNGAARIDRRHYRGRLVSIGSGVLAHISISLPTNLPGENPATFAPGGFQAAASKIALPASLTIWDWLSGPIVAIVALGICGWWMSGDHKRRTLWSAIRAA